MIEPSSVTFLYYLAFSTALILFFAALGKYVYRLTLHPLARFPGPKLAAATNLYGAFYDIPTSSSYIKSFPALHEKYGPIIRAWPNQLHFSSNETYNQIFKIGAKFDKDQQFYANPAIEGAFFEDASMKTALPRRNLMSPYFSREAVRRAESRITQSVDVFLEKLGEYAKTGRQVDLTKGFMCLAADAVMDFMFQKPYGALDAPNFESDLLVPVIDFSRMQQWPFYFPRMFGAVFGLTAKLPEWVIKKYLQGLLTQQNAMRMCHSQIGYLKSHPSLESQPSSVFDAALNPNVEKGQFAPPIPQLAADAFTFILAGTDTTSHTLMTAIFELLDGEPHMMDALKQELRQAMPTIHSSLEWTALEKLPYLRAVVKESLRLSYGAPGRIPRVVPQPGVALAGYSIPPGTIISSSIYVHNMNPTIFPDPYQFRPERWLVDDTKLLEQHMCSFSRGSRACLGINLAYAELYLTLAHLLRRFDLRLYETTRSDMEWKDYFTPLTKGNLRVVVQEVRD